MGNPAKPTTVELSIAGITTMEEANAFLAAFIKKYNEKFAVEPRDPQPYRELEDNVNLDHILFIKETRQVDHGSTFSYGGVYYRVIRNGKTIPMIPKAKVTVLKNTQFGLKVQYNGSIYDVEVLESLPSKDSVPKQPRQPRKPVTPAENHPWRTKTTKFPATMYDESDREILDALYSSRLAYRRIQRWNIDLQSFQHSAGFFFHLAPVHQKTGIDRLPAQKNIADYIAAVNQGQVLINGRYPQADRSTRRQRAVTFTFNNNLALIGNQRPR